MRCIKLIADRTRIIHLVHRGKTRAFERLAGQDFWASEKSA
ncbi:hypothetical protein C7S16_3472 [Burkholderia thailandensis]|uniref:Uncharacterized protein n=1 Tax=Burkholderia thailandensis TaxID=57975 RepID=A0AAW9D3Z9_BURTH|nr:hypothetical protein [Burkholderia thailandensis]MDW9256046.1 hypothetical protein [Burkholderia thailandensis]